MRISSLTSMCSCSFQVTEMLGQITWLRWDDCQAMSFEQFLWHKSEALDNLKSCVPGGADYNKHSFQWGSDLLLMATRPCKYFPLLPTKSPFPFCSLPEVENNSIGVREVRLWLVISWFKNTIHSIKDLMLLKLVLLCLCKSFLLNLLFKIWWDFIGYLRCMKLLLNFTCSEGNEFLRIWSYNCHKLPAGKFARLINMHFTRGKVKWVVKLYLWCFYCDCYWAKT